MYESAFLCENTHAHTFAHCERNKLQQTECQSYQEKWITSKLSRLCLTIKNDRIWLLWNNGGNSFEMRRIWEISLSHAGWAGHNCGHEKDADVNMTLDKS